MDKICKKSEIIRYFTSNIKELFNYFENDFWNKLTAVRLSVCSPLIIEIGADRFYLGSEGITLRSSEAYRVTKNDISGIFELVTNSSIYAYSRYVNEGFVTLSGGNRVGISGNCTVVDGKVTVISDIFSLNFRIAHEKIGVSDSIIKYIYTGTKINSTLIISPPGCGKTTFLRDIARSLGNYKSFNKIIVCALIDERYELGCARDGCACLDIGENNFLISGCTKSQGISIVTRSMAPDVIIVDEMCNSSDFEAAIYAKNSGCSIIASVHGENERINEMKLSGYDNLFETVIVLSCKNGPGTVEKILGG